MGQNPVARASAVLLLISACFAGQPKQDTPLAVSVGEVTDCTDVTKLPTQLTNIRLRVDYKSGDMFMNSTVILKRQFNDPIQLRFEFYKCVTKEVSSCSLQDTWERKTICDELPKKGMVWSPIMNSIKGMELKCPIAAGTYKMIEAPITKAIRENLPMQKGHWRLRVMLLKDGKTDACQRGYGEIKAKRRQKG